MSPSFSPQEIIRRAFPGIRPNEAAEMLDKGKVRAYPAEAVLCREGDIGTTFYIILTGEVRATKVINDNDVRVLKHLGPGDFFGEMALIHNAPRAATITATTPVTMIEIRKEAFSSLLERSSSMSLAIVREVSRRLRENDEMAIGDLRLKAAELADAYQQLAEQEYARRQFLTTIAHELRTPLTAASGFLHMAQIGGLQGDALSSVLSTATRNIQDIVALVNNILFLQEMDLILPEFQPTQIGDLVSDVIEKYRQAAEREGVTIRLTIAPGLPAIPVDEKSLARAISAIVENAIKFSPGSGSVLVDVGQDDDGVGGFIAVAVKDFGVGIPPEVQPRIFERFFHVDQVGEYLFRGVGLGLSIARQVIEQHGGHIEVQSELGQGSTFTVRLKK